MKFYSNFILSPLKLQLIDGDTFLGHTMLIFVRCFNPKWEKNLGTKSESPLLTDMNHSVKVSNLILMIDYDYAHTNYILDESNSWVKLDRNEKNIPISESNKPCPRLRWRESTSWASINSNVIMCLIVGVIWKSLERQTEWMKVYSHSFSTDQIMWEEE